MLKFGWTIKENLSSAMWGLLLENCFPSHQDLPKFASSDVDLFFYPRWGEVSRTTPLLAQASDGKRAAVAEYAYRRGAQNSAAASPPPPPTLLRQLDLAASRSGLRLRSRSRRSPWNYEPRLPFICSIATALSGECFVFSYLWKLFTVSLKWWSVQPSVLVCRITNLALS